MQSWLMRLAFGVTVGLMLQAWWPEARSLWTVIGAFLMWRRVTSWLPDGTRDPAN
jgi:hypothetical protein